MHYKLGTYSKLRALKNKHKTHMIIEGGHFEPFQCIYNLHESFDEVQLINSLSRAQVKNMRQFFLKFKASSVRQAPQTGCFNVGRVFAVFWMMRSNSRLWTTHSVCLAEHSVWTFVQAWIFVQVCD